MFSRSSPLRRPNGWCRRIALAALFALQGAIALAPLAETTEKGRLGAHAEPKGAQHKYQHDEATCAVCAVRSLHCTPVHVCPPMVGERQQSIAALKAPVAPARRVNPTTLP
ncbi:MAG: hypothetical protein ACREN6_15995, partial [Gemmatimonadaceae bacterium]